jgi:hypothetical protein
VMIEFMEGNVMMLLMINGEDKGVAFYCSFECFIGELITAINIY